MKAYKTLDYEKGFEGAQLPVRLQLSVKWLPPPKNPTFLQFARLVGYRKPINGPL